MKLEDISRATLATTRRVVASGAIAAVAVFGVAACEGTDDLEQEVRDGVEEEIENGIDDLEEDVRDGVEEGVDDALGGDEDN
ncbi:hypothetical protein GCM10007079_31170 [Nocardiopsis terrae]|uniref:Uncharacterized protein n=1 Tax=Nocardiopsis terrae TaxID=372655 RepID=A0ABR9HIU8_9ACTN|nr:hypothetical protein [Nocardiopsis terrae]MBE1458941.1 hypothetical protein [Nocardiopsis terrae]GHC87228.1 hypothetical protein GCM10007079_31170 [Nocardiopsis terrae]